MGAWYKSKEAQFLDLMSNILASCAVFYMLVRHALLTCDKLQPSALQCGDCTKALCVWLKSACGKPPNGTSAIGRHQIRTKNANDIHVKVIVFGTFGSLLSYLLACVNMSVSYMSQAFIGLLAFEHCFYSTPITGFFTLTAKLCMFAVFVARLHIGFHDSVHGYSKRLIFSLYTCIVCFALSWIAITVLFLRGHSQKHFCVTRAPAYFFPVAVAFDTVFNVSLVYLFSSATYKMLRNYTRDFDARHRAKDRIENAGMYELPLKYAVLSTVAVVSSMTTWLLYGLADFAWMVPWDNVVNCAALLLMTSKWKPVFAFLCSSVLRCVANRCMPAEFSVATETDSELLEKSSRKSTSVLCEDIETPPHTPTPLLVKSNRLAIL